MLLVAWNFGVVTNKLYISFNNPVSHVGSYMQVVRILERGSGNGEYTNLPLPNLTQFHFLQLESHVA